jgi:N-acetyl-1-D-myo-inositol-2-amino-2-deoxy-alpha-D-glucopyranoside deacetylase
MMGSESNANPECFWQADLEEATGRLVAVVRAAQPAVMVTYDARGNYGHPDHINAHRIGVAAMQAAADSSRFTSAGPAWSVAKFYEIAFNRDRWMAVMAEMKERGLKLPWDFDAEASADAAADTAPDPGEAAPETAGAPEPETAEEEEFGVPEAEITALVDVRDWSSAKRAAMACHRTQTQDFGWLLEMPDDLASRILTPEGFVLTRSPHRGIAAGLRESSLFEGFEESEAGLGG